MQDQMGPGNQSCLFWPGVLAWILLAFVAANLYGCCEEPKKQLNYEPDVAALKKRADWFNENGIWRGNPSWRFSPHLEVEDYKCKMRHPDRPICIVWTLHEWNCDEHDFGICKCEQLAEKGEYCQSWGCHALEADQNMCQHGKDSDTCHHEPFPMNEQVYHDLMERQGAGLLTTGETRQWWGFDSSWNYYRRLQMLNESSMEPHDRELSQPDVSHAEWPPNISYTPAWRHQYSHWGDVCIVNGDNVALARQRCGAWREIETEISHCKCIDGGGSFVNYCKRWTCEERDVGLFSIIFRTKKDINAHTTGTESEEYTCMEGDDNGCTAWEGKIASREEVELTRCECQGPTCNIAGAVWLCDEYELPRTRDWNSAEGGHTWILFLLPEVFIACFFCQAMGDGSEDAIPVACMCSSCVALIILPFLIITIGTYGFLATSLPFWIIRLLLGICICFPKLGCTSTPPGSQPYIERDNSSSERLKRGATKLVLGRVRDRALVAPA